MSDLLKPKLRNNQPLIACSLDIEKAFDCIPHNHQLRKLWLAGLPGYEDGYRGMTTTWEGELGEVFANVLVHMFFYTGTLTAAEEVKR